MSKATQAYKSPQTETNTPATKQTVSTSEDDLTLLKKKIMKEFGVVFGSENQFVVSKVFAVVFTGIRFCFERTPTGFSTSIIPISKKSGLLKPGYLSGLPSTPQKSSSSTSTGRTVQNLLTNKPALHLQRQLKPQPHLRVLNAECNDVQIGTVSAALVNGRKRLAFVQDGVEVGALSFEFRQPRSFWCCAARVPPALLNIRIEAEFKGHQFQVEENPNGEDCVSRLEVNFAYSSQQKPPNLSEFLALVSLLEAAAVELA